MQSALDCLLLRGSANFLKRGNSDRREDSDDDDDNHDFNERETFLVSSLHSIMWFIYYSKYSVCYMKTGPLCDRLSNTNHP